MLDIVTYVIGQLFGIVAVILGFICFRLKTPGKILALQIIVASVFVLHFLCLGVYSGAALNVVAGVQCVCYYFRDKRGSKSLVLPIVFTIVVIVACILTWDGWQCIFLMLGLIANCVSLSLSSAQNIRYVMFIKSPLCFVYNVIVFSLGGMIYETATFTSSIIGTVKYYSDKKKALAEEEKKNG